jgi:hypothetical protein
MFDLYWTEGARETYNRLKNDPSQTQRYQAVKKTIKLLAQNPKHPSLQTHEFQSLYGPNREKVFEAYAQQNTPSAYRLFWYYGSIRGTIIVLAITSHP